VSLFASKRDTQVYGLSRRAGTGSPGAHQLSVDLLNPRDVREKLSGIPLTHIVFAAYIEKATPAERSETNVAILRNLLEVVEQSSPALQHVTVVVKMQDARPHIVVAYDRPAQHMEQPLGDATALACLVAVEQALLMLRDLLPEGSMRSAQAREQAVLAAEWRLAELRESLKERS